ncbi:GRB10-interacting GYF protein 2 isoform X2 [Lampris incognitus]|uniref:GRB10-interacting GYF protein 2 isoform X2 n=1 Tax=Lampris incognitus TaxID=2546036 RepID=UPI0024B58EA5|nr:GRB10-interacting GYF protein 2 isoform X2 [Lampris incognitus]
MAETQTLNFGPEWLRALSGGGGGSGLGSSSIVASPPLSPALPKYKLADYRYGREEMLALYVKDNKVPIDLHDKEFLPILQDEPLPPLALVSFTEEEQRNFSMSVNSAAVLRLTGRGGGPIAGAPRGRSTSRGRGRGRGDGGFYQRSFDDVEGGFGRGGREMHRSQSWEERGDRRFEKPGRKDPDAAPAHFQINHIRANYEDVGTGLPRKHDFTRSESENWRTSRDDQNGEDDEGGWRLAGSRRDGERWCPPSPDGPRSAGWREHPEQRRRFPFDAREEERGYRRPRSGSGSLEDERDSLPEWCLEDAEEETGTFDSSGAFLSLKKASKEPILEEAELDFRPLEECEEGLEEEDIHLKETKEMETEVKRDTDRKEESARMEEEAPSASPPAPEPHTLALSLPPSQPSRAEEPERTTERTERQSPLEPRLEPIKAPLHVPMTNSMLESLPMTHIANTLTEVSAPSPTIQLQQQKPMEVPVVMSNPLPFTTSVMAPISRPAAMPHDQDEDEGLKNFEQEAEKMVAYLQDGGVDDDRPAAKSSEKPKTAGLPLTHEAALKWFYKDPQGEIQGPFSNQEMTEWFQAGYFTMTLLVKRGCDEVFQPLGEIIKLWGRVPFSPGPAPPPLQGDGDQERLKRQQELTALNLYQLQQLHYQYLLRQQYALAQQKAAALSSAPLQQQQQQQQQINLLIQQYQVLKMRASESLLPPVTRSLSVPDSGSVWEMQNTSSQASCTPNLQQAAPSTWDGSSVWDLPIDSMAQAPTIEQMQQLEKAKAAKLEQERREAEVRAKREEEERKRLEEALRARQEVERKHLEEEERARQKQEEALRRQREQEEAQRRQKEEEERLAQAEALRRLEERRREEEERKKREEFIRKQEEERRKQEELEALRRREEEKRAEEEAAAAAAAAALARQQQEEQKKREQEAQRQQELQRQRQQEALRRLQQQHQQQQLAQMKLPSSSKWGQQSANTINQTQNALSLAEIQKLEEERERQTREERRQQQELLKLQQQQALQQAQQPQAKLSGWGSVAKQPAATKSLLEIQREEAQQMKQRKEQQQQPHPTVTQQNRAQNRTSTLSTSVWGSVSTGTSSNWGSDSASIWGDTHNSNMGFWDEAVKEAAQNPPQSRKGNAQKNNKGNANLSNSVSGRANKKVEEEEKLLKLFQGVNKSQQDGFMQWCEQTLHTLNTANNLDVPTFASFLKEVDSPYEVHDYIRAYLGDTPEAKEFAKQFLERRAKQNANQQKQASQNQQQALKQQDSVWGGTVSSSLYQSNHTSLQQPRFETVTSGKKKKKQKMVRADPSLLGFSVNASSERLNMGEIETVEDF